MKVYEKPFAIFEKSLWYFSDASSVEELDGDGIWGLWESLAWTRHVICPGSELGDAVGRLSPQTVRPGGVTNVIFPEVRKLSRSQMGKKIPDLPGGQINDPSTGGIYYFVVPQQITPHGSWTLKRLFELTLEPFKGPKPLKDTVRCAVRGTKALGYWIPFKTTTAFQPPLPKAILVEPSGRVHTIFLLNSALLALEQWAWFFK